MNHFRTHTIKLGDFYFEILQNTFHDGRRQGRFPTAWGFDIEVARLAEERGLWFIRLATERHAYTNCFFGSKQYLPFRRENFRKLIAHIRDRRNYKIKDSFYGTSISVARENFM